MTNLTLDTFLEATDMGNNQEEIASWVMESDEWAAYVKKVNAQAIPESEDNPENPTDEWSDQQTFHPDELIPAACEALGWYSVPSTGGLVMNFYKK